MSYESRSYDAPGDGLGPDPVVVLVVRGTHDVSRFINLLAGSPAVIEQLSLGQHVRRQLRRHNGGTAAVKLLAEHGGPDFTAEDGPADVIERAARVLVANRFHFPHETWEWVPQGTKDRYLHDARTLAAAGLIEVPAAQRDDEAALRGKQQ